VASTGGHLAQLYQLSQRLDIVGAKRLWVTFESPQSLSVLESEEKIFVPYVRPRDWRAMLQNVPIMVSVFRSVRPAAVISTGAAIATAYLPTAAAMGIPAIYIESAARAEGPSLTGRMMAKTPGVATFTQYPAWSDEHWQYRGAVFDSYESYDRPELDRLTKVVVTLGTIEGYGFRRLVMRLLAELPGDVQVTWQVGDTDTSDLDLPAVRSMPSNALSQLMREADVVVAHAGIGSALAALNAGKCPVLVPREALHGEHVDDHQQQIAVELDRRGLAVNCSANELTLTQLIAAAGRGVRASLPQPMRVTDPSAPLASGVAIEHDE
jgi:UDP-N-acetylglucosamine--N-acetylmuramyl-(pentapeptide) pyrophosphoryl-undecaprenol N-acetylglucosamine transferase